MSGECGQHGELVETLKVMTGQMLKTLTALAVIQSTLTDLKATKALNCEARIAGLEDDSVSFRKLRVGPRISVLETNSSNCQELRAGPRLEKVEERQETIEGTLVGHLNSFELGINKKIYASWVVLVFSVGLIGYALKTHDAYLHEIMKLVFK